MEGWTLNEWLTTYGPVGEDLGKPFVKSLFRALSQLHDCGLSHNALSNLTVLIKEDSYEVVLQGLDRVSSPEAEFSDLLARLQIQGMEANFEAQAAMHACK